MEDSDTERRKEGATISAEHFILRLNHLRQAKGEIPWAQELGKIIAFYHDMELRDPEDDFPEQVEQIIADYAAPELIKNDILEAHFKKAYLERANELGIPEEEQKPGLRG